MKMGTHLIKTFLQCRSVYSPADIAKDQFRAVIKLKEGSQHISILTCNLIKFTLAARWRGGGGIEKKQINPPLHLLPHKCGTTNQRSMCRDICLHLLLHSLYATSIFAEYKNYDLYFG